MTAPINASFDFAALASLRNDATSKQDVATLKEAAKQFESLFTQMMLKSMRDANRSFGEGSMFDSSQGDFYQDMFDDQISLELSKGKGLGLADVLVRQLAQSGMVKGADAAAAAQAEFPATTQNVSAAGDHQPLAKSKEDFVKMMWPHAQRAGQALGVDPSALVAQAALETGWGRAVPNHSSGSSFNLFGIKAGSGWEGATATVPTLEFEQGVAVRKVERFRAYDSPADSFNDYARLIGNNPRYENARGAGGDVATFASALQEGGYATDPNYAQKIVAVADEVRALTQSSSDKSLKFAAAAPTNNGSGGLRRF
ncbi:peptidoglycan hydrolase FlgJ [Steroidobacter agaridevorans]|uniref:Peptidoglycan hydrolase FlgJ n=1 Tax=Steroidobacter agaridevorans TaxID=2695856 RepID=A0A829YNQ7_9GAMM|nr:flagellar assembly peptidoglycan hydrolase FlgJ [Steroidobacter agaridevorans]GFE84789.1 peptidoglycan hydrolase FlgJ [Steroidobacter agaridevorans]GFE86314.1 peptidoglycan hydrolase FlgJ [Steroidobacter agaridevorans]